MTRPTITITRHLAGPTNPAGEQLCQRCDAVITEAIFTPFPADTEVVIESFAHPFDADRKVRRTQLATVEELDTVPACVLLN